MSQRREPNPARASRAIAAPARQARALAGPQTASTTIAGRWLLGSAGGAAGRTIALAQGRDPARDRRSALVAVAGGVAAAWALNVYNSAPPLSSLKPVQKGRSSAIYAADGSLIGFIHSDNIRQPVSAQALPQDLKDATVAIEDKNFYNHGALDPAGDRPRRLEGPAGRRQAGPGRLDDHPAAGPQPLHPATPKRRSSERSSKRTSPTKSSRTHTRKDWILTHYLNTAPYGTDEGQTAVGVEAAAQTYFGKPAKDLTLTEAALIAGLPQAPSEYNPFLDPQAALQRRNEVLGAMERAGLHHPRRIPRSARTSGLGLNPGHKYQVDPRPLPLRPRPAGADRPLRDQHRPQRRAQGLHDDRPRPAGRRARSGRLLLRSATRTAARPPALASVDPDERRDRRPRLDPRLRRAKASSTTPGRPTASPAPRSRPTC